MTYVIRYIYKKISNDGGISVFWLYYFHACQMKRKVANPFMNSFETDLKRACEYHGHLCGAR